MSNIELYLALGLSTSLQIAYYTMLYLAIRMCLRGEMLFEQRYQRKKAANTLPATLVVRDSLRFSGRRNRIQLALFLIAFVSFGLLAVGFAAATWVEIDNLVATTSPYLDLTQGNLITKLLFALPAGVPFVLSLITVAAQRLRDIGISGQYGVLIWLPVLGQLMLLVLLVWPGQKGANRFGSAPDRVNAVQVNAPEPKLTRAAQRRRRRWAR